MSAPALAGGDGVPDPRAERPQTSNSPTEAAAAALPQILKVVGSIVAPTTLLTALMYYFGRAHATGLFRYLGVHVTVLDLTVQDYLIRSVDGLIVPMIVVALLTLFALWVHQLLLEVLPARTRRIALRLLMPSAAIAGSVLVSLAMVDLFQSSVFPAFPEARGLSLSIGVLLLAYAAQLLRLINAERTHAEIPRRTLGGIVLAEWGAIFVLVSVGLFWAVGKYAIGVGTGNAQQIEASLRSLPDVVAYSEKRLSLQAPGVREITCQDRDAGYRFRYDGLKLVQQSGNQYLFLPAGWTHTNGAAILIPRTEALRLEFSSAGQERNLTC